MTHRIIRMIFTFILVLIGFNQSAMAKCTKSFPTVDSNCIRQYKDKFKKFKIAIPTDAEKAEGLKNMMYFYQTEAGHIGKFVIRSAVASRQECSVILDVTTYLGKTIYSPTGFFTIKNEYNSWGNDWEGFSPDTTNDFILTREKNLCVFASENAKVVKYTKSIEDNLLEGRETLMEAGLALIFIAVFLVARAVFKEEDKFKAQEKLEDAEEGDKKAPSGDIILRYSRPFFKRYFSPVVSGMKNKKKFRDKYKRKLASSGMTKELSPEDFYAFKLFLIIGFPIMFLALREFLGETWPLAAAPALGAFGFMYPDIWVDGKIAKRKEDIIQSMPFIVDMLALSVEAGLDFMAAMQKVIDKAPPSALTEEFEIMIKETKVGASRAEGLRQLSWRTDCLPIASFCATLIAADAVGASIGPILKSLAGELRQKKSAEAEKKGATAATKILFPMMFLIMPSVMVIIMGPVLLQFLQGG